MNSSDLLDTFQCCGGKLLLGHDRVCKSKEQEPTDQDKISGPCLWYDNEIMPNTMYVSIPLHALAKNTIGTCLLRGWVEEYVKGLALNIIRRLRIAELKKTSRVIVPVGGNGSGNMVDLAAHQNVRRSNDYEKEDVV